MRKAVAIIGANYGDEGKGLMTDYVCSQVVNPLVVRFNGGPQAGHTVVRDGKRHIFSSFGSGTLFGAPTYLSEFVLIDPFMAVAEHKELLTKILQVPMLYVNANCQIITPADVAWNQHQARKNGHGSCGMGIFTTIQRSKKISFTYLDLFDSKKMYKKIEQIIQYYTEIDFGFGSMFGDPSNWEDFIESLDLYKDITNIATLSDFEDHTLVFEGAQGLLLDEEYGTMPYCTPSSTGMKNAVKLLNDTEVDLEIVYMTRAYLTRHGNGPLPNECDPTELGNITDKTNKTNDFQGQLRFAPLDVHTFLERIEQDSEYAGEFNYSLSVAITCIDQMPEGYRYSRLFHDFFSCVYESHGPSAKTIVKYGRSVKNESRTTISADK